MIQFSKIENLLFDDMKYDQIPLHDIVRYFSGFECDPTDSDFRLTMTFLNYFIEKYSIKCFYGKDMSELKREPEDLIDWLLQMWKDGNYKKINYGVWFEMKS